LRVFQKCFGVNSTIDEKYDEEKMFVNRSIIARSLCMQIKFISRTNWKTENKHCLLGGKNCQIYEMNYRSYSLQKRPPLTHLLIALRTEMNLIYLSFLLTFKVPNCCFGDSCCFCNCINSLNCQKKCLAQFLYSKFVVSLS
jgi:hypothetical protein